MFLTFTFACAFIIHKFEKSKSWINILKKFSKEVFKDAKAIFSKIDFYRKQKGSFYSKMCKQACSMNHTSKTFSSKLLNLNFVKVSEEKVKKAIGSYSEGFWTSSSVRITIYVNVQKFW